MTFNEFQKLTQFSNLQLEQYANKLSGGQKRLLDFCSNFNRQTSIFNIR